MQLIQDTRIPDPDGKDARTNIITDRMADIIDNIIFLVPLVDFPFLGPTDLSRFLSVEKGFIIVMEDILKGIGMSTMPSRLRLGRALGDYPTDILGCVMVRNSTMFIMMSITNIRLMDMLSFIHHKGGTEVIADWMEKFAGESINGFVKDINSARRA